MELYLTHGKESITYLLPEVIYSVAITDRTYVAMEISVGRVR